MRSSRSSASESAGPPTGPLSATSELVGREPVALERAADLAADAERAGHARVAAKARGDELLAGGGDGVGQRDTDRRAGPLPPVRNR